MEETTGSPRTIRGKLKSKKLVTNEDTYDIQTKNKNFFANGVLVHNSEILLRDKQMCNLSEVIIRKNDSKEDLLRKIRLATIVGTLQSTLTNFRYLRKKWSQNCEEERLLGVSLTGIMDNKLTNGSGKRDDLKELLNSLRAEAVKTNKEHANKLGINQSTAITCVKPSGCTTLDTEIRTEYGNMSMADIFSKYASKENIFECLPGTWIEPEESLKVYDENNNLQEVTKLFVNGIEEVFEIEDQEGNSYRFTGNHELKTVEGWKRVDQISENDEIIQFYR